jgi:hypothetical protein
MSLHLLVLLWPEQTARVDVASARSVETIDPLAQAIHLEIDSGVSNKDYSVLATKLLADPEDYGGKTF